VVVSPLAILRQSPSVLANAPLQWLLLSVLANAPSQSPSALP
jgi:hypothetical protein